MTLTRLKYRINLLKVWWSYSRNLSSTDEGCNEKKTYIFIQPGTFSNHFIFKIYLFWILEYNGFSLFLYILLTMCFSKNWFVFFFLCAVGVLTSYLKFICIFYLKSYVKGVKIFVNIIIVHLISPNKLAINSLNNHDLFYLNAAYIEE